MKVRLQFLFVFEMVGNIVGKREKNLTMFTMAHIGFSLKIIRTEDCVLQA